MQQEKAESLPGLVIESLFAAAHSSKSEVSIAAITETTNVGKWRRSGPVSAKMVGTILRRDLGLEPVRQGAGYVLMFEGEAQRAVDRAARSLGLLDGSSECPWCRGDVRAE